MSKRLLLPLLATAGLPLACGVEPPEPVPIAVPIQGAAIDGSEDVAEVEPEPEPEPEAQPESAVAPVPMAVSGEVEPDTEPDPVPEGPAEVSFWDLSLYELDVDAMLDAMLHPEEYTEEELEELSFPDEIGRYDGQEIVIQGYMIPGKMVLGNVRDFMLVRDLLGCCFGAQPMPDEWIDVVMHEDADAEYYQYIPVRVTGTLTFGGDQDKAGFARGVYKILATDVQEPD